jgi:hypothetical protein
MSSLKWIEFLLRRNKTLLSYYTDKPDLLKPALLEDLLRRKRKLEAEADVIKARIAGELF